MPPAGRDPRRHDLDALRGAAMLLGIVLHAALAYVPGIPWPVHDARRAPWLGLVVVAIHGFRMPLFFLLSGFFTALLWRRRGAAGMLMQRFTRVFVPLVLAWFTLLPAVGWMAPRGVGRATAGKAVVPEVSAPSPLVTAIRGRDAAGVAAALAAGADPDAPDPDYRMPPITLAALVGDAEVAGLLLDAGANPGAVGGDGRTPLHAAAFAGRLSLVELLLDRGADPAARGREGDTVLDATLAGAGATAFIASLLRIDLGQPATLSAGRAAVRARLAAGRGDSRGADAAAVPPRPGPPPPGLLARARSAYREWLLSPRFVVSLAPNGEPRSLFVGSTVGYLWFLWFLCWYAAGFGLLAAGCQLPGCTGVARMLHVPSVPRRLVTFPAALLWVVPLSLVPQLFMGIFTPLFGPDTSLGLLPQPHVLASYAVFFGYGAALHLADDDAGAVGRRWPFLLAIALLVCLPAGLVTMSRPEITALPQVLYAWLMCFGCIGLFRRLVPRESRGWRYLSDSSYWLYLAHLPLVILIQQHSRDWPWPAPLKFVVVCAASTAVLLASYQLFVRHTPLGVLLNGPRRREPGTGAG